MSLIFPISRRGVAFALSLTLGVQPALAQPVAADSARTALLTRADLGRVRGQSDAPVWIVVMSDFQCPFCKRWHEETAPALERNYVRTGKARIAYLNFPINTHRNAQPAHELAMCAAEQDRFWSVADELFATQNEWKSLLDPMPFFDALAAGLPLEHARLRACLASGQTRALIRSDHERSVRIGVGSTPSFLIGGTPLIGAQPYEVFAAAIDAALRAAQQRRPTPQ
jgi:protein-disulfide isomerase